MQDVHQRNLCVGCGACVDLCPYFKSHRGKIAMLFPCNRAAGRCYAYCPKTEVDLDLLARRFWGRPYDGDPLGHSLKIMTTWAGEKAPRGPFQAGGTVSSLIGFALEEGLVDAAVLTGRQGLIPAPRLATRPEEVAACASSKYTAAPTLSAFHRAVREGRSKLAVVGTPCQATSLAKMRVYPVEDQRPPDPALIVGLFCTWAVDTRGLIDLLSERLGTDSIRKMDIPPPPAEKMVVETGRERVEIPLGEVRPLVPEGCRFCPDMTAEWADLSVGVLEEDPHRNTLVIRTERGMELVEKALKRGWLSAWPVSQEAMSHLAFAAANKRKRALQRAREQGLLNSDCKNSRGCLRLDAATVNRILQDAE